MSEEEITELLLWTAQHADKLNDIAHQAIALSAEAVTDMLVQTAEQFLRKLNATQCLLALRDGYQKLSDSEKRVERGLNV